MIEITKAEAKRLLGFETDAALADWFHDKPSKQAVSQWKEEEPLPSARQWELRARNALHPDIFGQAPEASKDAA